MLEVNTYSPSDVKLVIGGYTLVGWESITITRNTTSFTARRGIRGKNARTRNLDTSAEIQISLVQTSPSNDVLSTIHTLDIQRGTGRLSLILKDLSGRSVFGSEEGYILSYPEVSYSAGIEMRTWTIACQTTSTYIVGGNTKPDTPLVDSILNGVKGVSGNIF